MNWRRKLKLTKSLTWIKILNTLTTKFPHPKQQNKPRLRKLKVSGRLFWTVAFCTLLVSFSQHANLSSLTCIGWWFCFISYWNIFIYVWWKDFSMVMFKFCFNLQVNLLQSVSLSYLTITGCQDAFTLS
jgi:hypothetical protein